MQRELFHLFRDLISKCWHSWPDLLYPAPAYLYLLLLILNYLLIFSIDCTVGILSLGIFSRNVSHLICCSVGLLANRAKAAGLLSRSLRVSIDLITDQVSVTSTVLWQRYPSQVKRGSWCVEPSLQYVQNQWNQVFCKTNKQQKCQKTKAQHIRLGFSIVQISFNVLWL